MRPLTLLAVSALLLLPGAAFAEECTDGVNVCPTATYCEGAVDVCPMADPDACHGYVDVCLDFVGPR
ncbi:MAG TPA: hypothetical protein VGX28_11945 [Frankiaceae bacterium]|jgi:hypothetical protein|nr:hypothetical protein [Frankiaceae bacterium]